MPEGGKEARVYRSAASWDAGTFLMEKKGLAQATELAMSLVLNPPSSRGSGVPSLQVWHLLSPLFLQLFSVNWRLTIHRGWCFAQIQWRSLLLWRDSATASQVGSRKTEQCQISPPFTAKKTQQQQPQRNHQGISVAGSIKQYPLHFEGKAPWSKWFL